MCLWLSIVGVQFHFVLYVISSNDVFKDLSISFYDEIKSENSLELHNFTLGPNKYDVTEAIDITTSPNTKNNIIRNRTDVINQNKTTKIFNDLNYNGHKRGYKKNDSFSNVASRDVTYFSTLGIRRALDSFTLTLVTNKKYHKGNHTAVKKNKEEPNETPKINTKSSKTLSSRSIKYFSTTTPPTEAILSPKSSLKEQYKSSTKEEKPVITPLLSEGNKINSKFRELKNLGAELLAVDKDYVFPSPEQENRDLNRSYSNKGQNYDFSRVEYYTAEHFKQEVVKGGENNNLVPEPEEVTERDKNLNNNFKFNYSDYVYDVPKGNEIGAHKNIRGHANNFGGGIKYLNPALESSPVSYSYPTEYIFEVLASPGIPEAINFRASNERSDKPDLFLKSQTTVHDIFLDVDPEMFNLDKKSIRNNISKIAEPKKLVPEPIIITHHNISEKNESRVLDDDDFALFTTQQEWPPPTKKHKTKISKNPLIKTFSAITEERIVGPPRIPKEEPLIEQNTEVSSTPYSTRTTQDTHTPVTASTSTSSSSTTTADEQNTENEFIPYYDTNYDYYQSNLSTTEYLPTTQEEINMQEKLITAYRANKISIPFLRMTVEVLNATTASQSESPRERWWTPNNLSTIDPFKTFLNTLPKEEKQLTTTRKSINYKMKDNKTTTQAQNIVSVVKTQAQTFAAHLDSKEKLELERKKMEEGHFTYIVYKFMEFIMMKRPPLLAKRLLDQLLPATVVWYRLRPNMYKLGEPFTKGIHTLFGHLRKSSPETLQKTVSSFYESLKIRQDAFSPELNYLFSIMDKIYTQDEVNKIYVTLKEVKNYPNTTKTANEVIFHLLEKVFVEPFHRLGPTKRRHKLVENLNIYISYKYFNGTQIFIPENALRRKIEDDSSVVANRRKQKRSNMGKLKFGNANWKKSIKLMKSKQAFLTKDNKEQDTKVDKEGTSKHSAQAEEEKLKAKLNKKMITESSMLTDKNIKSTTYNTVKEKAQVTGTLRQGKIIHKIPKPYSKKFKTYKQVMKKNVEKVNSLSAENFKYIIEKKIPINKIREKISTLQKYKNPKFLKNNIAAQHNSFIKKSNPKFDDYAALNTEEFLEIIKKGDFKLSNNKNKHISPVSREINDIKKQTTKSRHQTQQLNRSKKRVVDKYHSHYEIQTKSQFKMKIKKQRNEKHVINANKKLRLSNQKSEIVQKSLAATTRKGFNLLKKHIKLKSRDHKNKQITTKRSKSLINKISKKRVNKNLKKPDSNVKTSKKIRHANRGNSGYHRNLTGNYIYVENDSSSLDWAVQKHLFVDNKKKVIKESLKNRSKKAFVKKRKARIHFPKKKEMTTKGRERNTSEFRIISVMPITRNRIIKQIQIEIFKTKVPYTRQEILRDQRKKPNRQTENYQEYLNSYKYLEAQTSGKLSYPYVSKSSKSSVYIAKNRNNKSTHHERQVELFNAYDNTDSSDSLEDDGRKNEKFIRKTNYESSYSEQEINLKANLEAALFHGFDLELNRRMLNEDVNDEHAKLNLRMLSPSSKSDEEHLIKSNIYKSFGYRSTLENDTQLIAMKKVGNVNKYN